MFEINTEHQFPLLTFALYTYLISSAQCAVVDLCIPLCLFAFCTPGKIATSKTLILSECHGEIYKKMTVVNIYWLLFYLSFL